MVGPFCFLHISSCREENVNYGEVCGGFSMQALECFGVSGDGLSAWRVLAGANCCQQCIT